MYFFEDAVDASCFGRRWAKRADPLVMSASTLEACFLCRKEATTDERFAWILAFSGLECSLEESASFTVDPWNSENFNGLLLSFSTNMVNNHGTNITVDGHSMLSSVKNLWK